MRMELRHVFTVALMGVVGACVSDDELPADEEDLGRAQVAQTTPLRFNEACRQGQTLTIAAVGDVILHSALQRQAYASSDLHFSLWNDVVDLVARADMTYGNFEGTAARGVNADGVFVGDPGLVLDGIVYSGTGTFNYHPSLIRSLLDTGFDIVSTGNNHAMDRRALGADMTLTAMNNAGLKHAGTRKSYQTSSSSYATIVERNGFRIAWIACSYGTNVEDVNRQVLLCPTGVSDQSRVESLIRRYAARDDVDAVIVAQHTGKVGSHEVLSSQRARARKWLEAGAIAVIGNHPHVVQPWEKIMTSDDREGFVIYSIGNFVSGYSDLDKRSSLLLYLGLTKSADGRVTINGVRYVPTYMLRSPYRVVPADTLSTSAGIASYDLTTGILGTGNVLASDEPLVTNPECE